VLNERPTRTARQPDSPNGDVPPMNNYDALDLLWAPDEPALDVLDDVSRRHPILAALFRLVLRVDAWRDDVRSSRR